MYLSSPFSRVRCYAILWTVAYQAPLSVGFSRKEYWSGLLYSSPGDLPDLGIELRSLKSPVLAGGFFFTTSTTWEAQMEANVHKKNVYKNVHRIIIHNSPKVETIEIHES